MFVTALLLGLVGVFCILDSRILGRMNFERPLITCTIVGALLGDLQTGLTLGASIELMSLGIVNIGCLLYTSPSPRDPKTSRMPSSA